MAGGRLQSRTLKFMTKINFRTYLGVVCQSIQDQVIDREAELHEKYKDHPDTDAYKQDELYHSYLMLVGACEAAQQIHEVFQEIRHETVEIPDESLN